MAVEHILALATDEPLDKIMHQWFKDIKYSTEIKKESYTNGMYAEHPYFSMSGIIYQNPKWKSKRYDFQPNIIITFRLLPHGENSKLALDIIKKGTIKRLEASNNPLTLVVYDDTWILSYKNNEIIIDPNLSLIHI